MLCQDYETRHPIGAFPKPDLEKKSKSLRLHMATWHATSRCALDGASKANKSLYSRQLRNWDKECAVQSINDVAKLFPSSVLTGSSRHEQGTLLNYTNSDLLLSKRRQSCKPSKFSNLIRSPRATRAKLRKKRKKYEAQLGFGRGSGNTHWSRCKFTWIRLSSSTQACLECEFEIMVNFEFWHRCL